MSEFTTPPPGQAEYNVEDAQQFLRSVGQFDQTRLHPELASNLRNLDLVWDRIDHWIGDTPSNGTDSANERVYSGFSETGQYFEVYGFPLHFEDQEEERVLYTGQLGFHADLHTGGFSVIRPDIFYDDSSMQLCFLPSIGAPDATANRFNYEMMGRARLVIATSQVLPPEDFYIKHRGERETLLDTETFQRRTNLYTDQIRDGVYHPEPSYYNNQEI